MSQEAARPSAAPATVLIVDFDDAGVRKGEISVPKVVKSDEEWRKVLDPVAYNVTRHDGTEFAFTGQLWDLHDKGLFRCVCCGTALFSSETKFDSGTGWPSFCQPIAEQNIAEQSDSNYGMTRTAVSCPRCDAHLGHLFPDGPRPTGLRYCINSAALRFVKS